MSHSAPEQATKVAIYTLSGDRGLRRCVRWRVMILTTTGKRIALLTTRTLKDGQHTGEISLATTDETDSEEHSIAEHYWLADRLHRGAPAVFELALGRPADIMFFIDSMRHDASRHLWVSSGKSIVRRRNLQICDGTKKDRDARRVSTKLTQISGPRLGARRCVLDQNVPGADTVSV